MTKELKFIFSIIICGLLQAAVMPNLKFFGVMPDLLLIIVVLGGVYFSWGWSCIFGVLAGLLKDIFSVDNFAVNIFIFSLWGHFIPKITRKVSVDDIIALPFFVFIVTFITDIVFRFILLFQGKVISLGIFLKVTILGSIYNALILLLVFRLLKYFKCLPRK